MSNPNDEPLPAWKMKEVKYPTSSTLEQKLLESLVSSCEEIMRLEEKWAEKVEAGPRGLGPFEGNDLEAIRDMRRVSMKIAIHAGIGHTLFGMLSESIIPDPFGRSSINEKLVDAFEEAGFEGVDCLACYGDNDPFDFKIAGYLSLRDLREMEEQFRKKNSGIKL